MEILQVIMVFTEQATIRVCTAAAILMECMAIVIMVLALVLQAARIGVCMLTAHRVFMAIVKIQLMVCMVLAAALIAATAAPAYTAPLTMGYMALVHTVYGQRASTMACMQSLQGVVELARMLMDLVTD